MKSHLQKINCGGLIKQAVLGDNFSCSAYLKEHGLFVHHPGFGEQKESFGVLDLDTLIKCVPEGEVDLNLKEHTAEINKKNTNFSLRIADPDAINTSVGHKRVKMVMEGVEEEVNWFKLDKKTVEEIKHALNVIRSDYVRISLIPQEIIFVTGTPSGNEANVRIPWEDNKDTYSMKFSTKPLTSIIGTLDFDEDVALGFTGKDSLIVFMNGNYSFMLQPMEEGDG